MFKAVNYLGLKALVAVRQQSRHASRNLFTANALGVTKLDQLRSQKSQMFVGESRQRYIERLNNFLETDDSTSIYKEDLVNIIGIAESEKDLDLVERILENSSGEQRHFFSGWGAALMRLYYKMNQLDRAVTNIRDVERFGQCFNTKTCYKVVMTMLYDNGKYEKVLDIFRLSQERLKETPIAKEIAEKTGADPLPDRELVMVLFAALTKINTPEALNEAKRILSLFKDSGRNIGLRPTSLVAYMAMMNGDLNYAVNLISSVPGRNYVSLRDINILCFLRAGRYEDVLIKVREYAASVKVGQNQLLETTFEELVASKAKIEDVAVRQELDDILTEIKNGKHVSDETLENLVFRPIDLDTQEARLRRDNDGSRDKRGLRDSDRTRRPFRQDRYSGDERYQRQEDIGDSHNSRRDSRGGSNRNDRRFSFQNVNFET